MSKKWRGFIWLALTILFMLLIFIKSSEPYQEQDLKPALSSWISITKVEKIVPHIEFYYDHEWVTWKNPYGMLEFFIRKIAHVTEFAILTLLWLQTLSYTKLNGLKCALLSAIIAVFYAASDEWHQTFVPGRTGHAIDVGIDFIGIALVVLLFLCLNRKKLLSKHGK